MFELKGLKKPKGLKGLRGLGPEVKLPPIPDLDSGPGGVAGLVDDELASLARTLGSERFAKKILTMKKKEEYRNATFPELVAIEWLTRHTIKWGFQVWALGGRKVVGGQVLDLIVDAGRGVYVWEIQGNYWHNRPGKVQLDRAQKLALLGIHIWGKPVLKVIELWESRIMSDKESKRDHLFHMATSGVEVGP